MATTTVKLKNYQGVTTTYSGIERITIPDANGTPQTFTLGYGGDSGAHEANKIYLTVHKYCDGLTSGDVSVSIKANLYDGTTLIEGNIPVYNGSQSFSTATDTTETTYVNIASHITNQVNKITFVSTITETGDAHGTINAMLLPSSIVSGKNANAIVGGASVGSDVDLGIANTYFTKEDGFDAVSIYIEMRADR